MLYSNFALILSSLIIITLKYLLYFGCVRCDVFQFLTVVQYTIYDARNCFV